MKNYLIILCLALATSVQAQFTALLASTSNQDGGLDYSLEFATHSGLSFTIDKTITGINGEPETFEVANGDFWIAPSGNAYRHTFTEGDVSTLTITGDGAYSSNQSRNMLHWSHDGLALYTANFAENVIGYGGGTVPYSVTGRSYLGTMFNLTGYETDGRGYAYNDDGSKIWMNGVLRGKIYEYDVVPAYTGSTSVTLIDSLDITSQSNTPAGLDISADGKYMIYGNRGDDSIDSWKLTTAGTIADGATFDYKLDIDAETTTIYSVQYSEDGHYIYLLDTSLDEIQQVNINNDGTNTRSYIFPDAVNGYFTTDFDLNGLTEHTMVVIGTMDNDAEENTMLGSSSTANFYFRRHSGGNIWITLNDGTNVTETSRAWTYAATETQWAFKYDETNGAEVFANGASLGAAFDTDFTGHTTTQLLSIGRRFGNTSSQMDGKIREIQIYDRALTDTEIANINTDPNNTAAGLVCHFRGKKTDDTWTDEVAGYIATNAGAVTLED